MFNLRSSAAIVTILFVASSLVADDRSTRKDSAELAAEIDGPLLVDFPLLFKLTVTNTGDAPMYYWCGGPAQYPTATPFVVEATNADGKTWQLRLDNGQYRIGSGSVNPIEKTQTLPAAGDSLPAGDYTLQVTAKADYDVDKGEKIEVRPAMSSKPLKVTIVEDRAALEVANKKLLDRKGAEPFAKFVAETYSIDPVVQTWLDQLLDDDIKVGMKAIGHLQNVSRFPPGGDKVFLEAAQKFCGPKSSVAEKNRLRYISLICRRIHTDNATDAIATIASSAADEKYARHCAALDLAGIPGERAEKALLALAADKDSPIYWDALLGVARHKNTMAVKPLLQAATDPKAANRAIAMRALGDFRDVPEVRSVLTAAAEGEDSTVTRVQKGP